MDPGHRSVTTFLSQPGIKESFKKAVGLGKWQQKFALLLFFRNYTVNVTDEVGTW